MKFSSLMLQNYTPGNPAPVLYIKNLAKDVIVDDFYFIFGKYFEDGCSQQFCFCQD